MVISIWKLIVAQRRKFYHCNTVTVCVCVFFSHGSAGNKNLWILCQLRAINSRQMVRWIVGLNRVGWTMDNGTADISQQRLYVKHVGILLSSRHTFFHREWKRDCFEKVYSENMKKLSYFVMKFKDSSSQTPNIPYHVTNTPLQKKKTPSMLS